MKFFFKVVVLVAAYLACLALTRAESPSPRFVVSRASSPTQFEVAPAPPQSYQEALDQSVQLNRPMVVWVGEALCPGCVATSRAEFVHWVAPVGFPGTPKDALVIGYPDGGQVFRIGTVTEWPKGHLDTARDIIERWRTKREGTFPPAQQYRPLAKPQLTQPQLQSYIFAPQFFRRGGGARG